MAEYKTRAIVMSIPNNGYPNARNRGITVATGEYIVCLDADDTLLPNFLKEATKKANAKTIVAAWGQYFGESSELFTPQDVDLASFRSKNRILSCSLFSKSMWLEVGGYDEEMKRSEDWDLWLRALVRGYKIEVVGEILVSIRRHPESVSQSGREDVWTNYLLKKMGYGLEFDENEYLAANPDVRDSVMAKKIGSGWEHYVRHGCRESRGGVSPQTKILVCRVVDTILR
jgi:glycosyltransferase involved in cell wall biosynthesis